MQQYHQRVLAISFLAACTLATAGTASCADIWAKAGTDATSMQAEYQACVEEARFVGVTLDTGRTGVSAPGGQLIGMIVGAGFSAALTPKARLDYLNGCMEGRGYRPLNLTVDETADLSAQKTPEARTKWITAFYNRSGLTIRTQP
ncbi:MAG TPA: hypothetical protein VHZ26_13935 [Caulobacteraceae bacterium]|jgi:hypothetical protein|nr:hypothetical protein [Caulobacteraceae bacterium]